MDKEKINDILFEALFSQAVLENHNRELMDIPTEDELAKTSTYSEHHEKRMKKLFSMKNEKNDSLTFL